jgi:hypothetical protein
MGSLSAFLTYHLGALFHSDPSSLMRLLKAAGVALVVPGIVAAMLLGNVHAFALSLAAVVNFVFWFAFTWLVGVFIIKIIQLRRAIAAVGSGAVGTSSDSGYPPGVSRG